MFLMYIRYGWRTGGAVSFCCCLTDGSTSSGLNSACLLARSSLGQELGLSQLNSPLRLSQGQGQVPAGREVTS